MEQKSEKEICEAKEGLANICKALQKKLAIRIYSPEDRHIAAEVKGYWRIMGYGLSSSVFDALSAAGLDYSSDHKNHSIYMHRNLFSQGVGDEWVLRGNSFKVWCKRKLWSGDEEYIVRAKDSKGIKVIDFIDHSFYTGYSLLCCFLKSYMGIWEKEDWQKVKID